MQLQLLLSWGSHIQRCGLHAVVVILILLLLTPQHRAIPFRTAPPHVHRACSTYTIATVPITSQPCTPVVVHIHCLNNRLRALCCAALRTVHAHVLVLAAWLI